MCLLEIIFIIVKAENRVSAIQVLGWLLISLNTEKLRSASADVTGRVHVNTSKIIIFGKEFVSADTKDFIEVSGKSVPCQTVWITY